MKLLMAPVPGQRRAQAQVPAATVPGAPSPKRPREEAAVVAAAVVPFKKARLEESPVPAARATRIAYEPDYDDADMDVFMTPPPPPPQSQASASPRSPSQSSLAQTRRKKKKDVHDPSAVFLVDPSVSQRGVLVFEKPAGSYGITPYPANEMLPQRHEQNSRTLSLASDQWPWLDTQNGPDGAREQPIITLLGPSQFVRSVPLGEALIMMHREFNDRLGKMHQLRVKQSLPTGLEQASGAVRLASGLPAVQVDPSVVAAEKDKRLPPLVGLPATTLAKTRQTWLPGGQLVVNHGFTHDSTRGSLLHVTNYYNADYARLYANFYVNDPSEQNSAARSYMKPDDFAMYRQLRLDHGDRFLQNDKFLEHAALNVSRVAPPVELRRSYIYLFRFPARHELGEDDCSRDQECLFVIMARKLGSQTSYPGRRFLLPDELAVFERTGKLPPGRGLCYDCELEHYMQCMYTTLSNLRVRTQPINRFTVCCEKGEFDVRDMMPNIVSERYRTRIVGYVPKYRRSMHQFVSAVRPDDPDGPVHGKKLRILNDLSLNF